MFFRISTKITMTTLLLAVKSIFLQAQAPTITPVAPEAAALAKEVNYEVSYNTGVPNISVPLTQIQTGSLTLPLVLNYHSGGFKTNERSTSIGLGFSLSCDIQITRTINGLDDFDPVKGYLANNNMKAYDLSNFQAYPFCWRSSRNEIFATEAESMAQGAKDGMPDKFNYRLINKSGSFYFMKDNTGTSYSIVTVPYDNTIKIQFIPQTLTFTIVDADGATYYFRDWFEQPYRDEDIYPDGTIWLGIDYTTWKCQRIENAQKTAYLEFSYVRKSPVQHSSWPERIEYTDDRNHCYWGNSYASPLTFDPNNTIQFFEDIPVNYRPSYPRYTEYLPGDRTGGPGMTRVHIPYFANGFNDRVYKSIMANGLDRSYSTALALSQISFRGGKVKFYGTDQLESISVIDADEQEVKSFVFRQSYTLPTDLAYAQVFNGSNFKGTLFLDGIEVKKGGVTIEKFDLQYANKFCFGSHLKGRDVWGQVNEYTVDQSGGFQGSLSIPNQRIAAQLLIQSSIPCVWSDFFTFSIGNSVNTEAPSSRCMVGLLSRLVYPDGGFVDFQFEPNKYNFSVSVQGNNPSGDPAVIVSQAGGVRIKSITYFDGKSPVAAHQKYFRYGEMESGVGLVARAPNRRFDGNHFKFNAYAYKHVTVFETEGGWGLGSILETSTYEPASALDYTFIDGASIYYTKVTEYNSDMGVKTGKKVYTYYPPGQFNINDNNYSKVEGTNVNVLHTDGLTGKLHFESEYKCEKDGLYKLLREKEYEYQKFSLPQQVRVASAYRSYTLIGPNREIVVSDENYTLNECTAFTTVDYGLEVGCLLLKTEKEKLIRDGQSFTNTVDYYYDNSSYLQPSRIVTSNSKNEVITKTLRYPYDYNAEVVYQKMKTLNMINHPVEEIVYNTDQGQEISRSKTNYKEVVFDDDDEDYLSFIVPSSIEKSFGGAGSQTEVTFDAYDRYGNVVQLTKSDGITISYLWGYGQLYPIGEFKGITYKRIADASYSVVGHQALLDTRDAERIVAGMNERRSLFPGALISSFTHKPIVGVASVTNPSGVSSYYEYDEGGRLRSIKDNNGDLTKTYDYNLVNVTEGYARDGYYYTNVPYMETYYYTCANGSKIPYNYTIDGGKYLGLVASGAVNQVMAERDLYVDGKYTPPGSACAEPGVELVLNNLSPLYHQVADVYIDFVKGDEVMYSVKFDDNAGYNQKRVYIPAGEYQVNLRMDASYNKDVVTFGYAYLLNDLYAFTYLRPGQVVNITPESFHVFTVSTTWSDE